MRLVEWTRMVVLHTKMKQTYAGDVESRANSNVPWVLLHTALTVASKCTTQATANEPTECTRHQSRPSSPSRYWRQHEHLMYVCCWTTLRSFTCFPRYATLAEPAADSLATHTATQQPTSHTDDQAPYGMPPSSRPCLTTGYCCRSQLRPPLQGRQLPVHLSSNRET